MKDQEQNKHITKTVENIIYELIFNYIKHYVYIMKVEDGPHFRYLYANELGLELAGLSSDALGKRMEDVLTYEHHQTLQQHYEHVLRTNSDVEYAEPLHYPDGRLGYTETLLTPIINNHNNIEYIVAVTRNITEVMEEKERLKDTEQKYRSFLDHHLDGVFTLSKNGNIIEVNPAGQTLVGYSDIHLRDTSFFDLIPDDDIEVFSKLFQETLSGLALESLDCSLMHSESRHFVTQLKTIPIRINGEINGLYVLVRDISAEKENIETINYMAFHDQLTGLYNRRALLDDLGEAIIKYKNKGTFSLLSIDLDRFKFLNDTLGHRAGDQILIQVAERLLEYSKEHIRVYRQGGDEFSLLFEGPRTGASKLAQKILSCFARSFYFDYKEYFISPSIGISSYPHDGGNVESLIKNADEALFSVKERGKAHFQFYRSEMNATVSDIVSVETHLRKAVLKNEFVLFYQPQVDLATGSINSFEALIRWDSQELGMVSPLDFIPLAEETGLIIPIGNWVVETACRQISEWSKYREQGIKIAINISPKQFLQPNLVVTIKEAIEKYKIDPALLEIEITEGALLDIRETSPILEKLKAIGVTISVDDFGTGYSSLNYIKQFPIDVLKIDRSFVHDVISNEKDAAITTTIIHLAHSLGIEVVAEGIEVEEQVDFLKLAYCHKGQGYLFSKPISAEEVEKCILQKNLE